MTGDVKYWLTRPRLRLAILAIAVTFCGAMPAAGQYPGAGAGTGQASALAGSVPSGAASDEVLHLTLRDARSPRALAGDAWRISQDQLTCAASG